MAGGGRVVTGVTGAAIGVVTDKGLERVTALAIEPGKETLPVRTCTAVSAIRRVRHRRARSGIRIERQRPMVAAITSMRIEMATCIVRRIRAGSKEPTMAGKMTGSNPIIGPILSSVTRPRINNRIAIRLTGNNAKANRIPGNATRQTNSNWIAVRPTGNEVISAVIATTTHVAAVVAVVAVAVVADVNLGLSQGRKQKQAA